MPVFLLEIGLEEIPARMIAAAQKELAERVEKMLTRENLLSSPSVRSYSTPRRLAVLVEGVLAQQPDTQEELVGPSLKVAYKDGAPTGAAVAFAKKAGVEVSALQTITNAKGEYIGATVERKGRPAAEVLAEMLPREMTALYWGKSMYWRAGKPERFVRPLRWLLALLDGEVVPLEFAGIKAGGVSYGHRVLHGESAVQIRAPSDYVAKLEAAKVVVDVEVRRQKIRKALDAATRAVPGARWRENEELVDAVTHLTEWPTVLLGNFEKEHLALPEEILETVMHDHQKQFVVEDADHKLLPYFLAVLNTEVDAAGAAIIRHGNERVLRARFNDARFFWDVDQKIPLVNRVEMLKNVTFHKDLGSYWDKTERIRSVARNLITSATLPLFAEQIKLDTFRDGVDQAALLSKTDLTTDMVKEFTELQGVVGGLYARAQKLPDGVARAIADQYKPASSEDSIPRTPAGCILALADKISTIVDMFAKGLQPTGSKDPFALRRAGNGVVKILAESGLPFKVKDVLLATNLSSGANETAVTQFVAERIAFYLQEVRGFSQQGVVAVMASGCDMLPDAIARAEAVDEVRSLPDFVAISAAFKRMKNILKQNSEEIPRKDVNESLLIDPAEVQLWKKARALAAEVEEMRKTHRYQEALEAIATLRPDVDAFFNQVMVMAPEPELRENRLKLVAAVLMNFTQIADFSELASA